MDNLQIKTLPVCRTCMEEIAYIPFFNLDFTQVNTEPTIRQKLSNCIPELDLSIVRNPIICSTCSDIINIVHDFKTKCHRSELQIHKYTQQLQHTGDVDLAEVTKFNQLRCESLSTQFKTEAIELTENFKYQEASTLHSHDTAFNDVENDTKSNNIHNEYLLSLQKVDIKCVLFNTDDGLLNYTNPATEQNSIAYDNSNILQDCTTQMVDNRDGNVQDLDASDIFYKCYNTCGHKSKSKLKSILHMKSHTDKKWHQNKIACVNPLKKYNTLVCRYRCCLCNYLTKYKWSLGFHIRIHLTKNYKQILKRRHIKKIQSSITFNEVNKDGKGKYSNRSCKKQVLKSQSDLLQKYLKSKSQFSQRDNFNSNVEAHTANKPFKCSICEYHCRWKSSLKQHMLVHTGEKPFTCSFCAYHFGWKSSLKKHMLIHTGENPYTCSICAYQCRWKSSLDDHMLMHTGNKLFRCSVCEYQCKRKSNLKRHIQIHTGEKSITCTVCEYRCRQKSDLMNHIRVHTGENLFTCSVCEFQCKRKSDLKRHTQIHTGEKSFTCAVCEYQCRRKSYLKVHMQIHTGEKPVTCSVCEYRCRQKSDLKHHIRIHTGEKPFTCSFCEYQCRRKTNLKRHMKSHTTEKSFKC